MGNIASQFATAFRDFATDGVASSGPHEVVKEEVRAIGPIIEAAIGNAGLGALVDVVKATRSDLNADLAHPADTVALVYADATDANNDLYIKVGASGSGSWTLTTILHDIVEALAAPQITLAAAEADRAEAAAENVSRKSANLLDPLNAGWATDRRVNPPNGELVVLSGWDTTPFIPVVSGQTYITNVDGYFVQYNTSEGYVGSLTPTTVDNLRQVTATANGFIRGSIQRTGNYARSQIFFIAGSSAPTQVEPSGDLLKEDRLFGIDAAQALTIFDDASIEPRKLLAWEESPNKANPVGRVDGFFMSSSGGLSANSTYSVWPAFRVAPGQVWTANQSMRFVTFFDAGRRAMTAVSITTTVSSFTVPAGACFAVPTSNLASVGSFAIALGASVPVWSPYGWRPRTVLPNGEPVSWGVPDGSDLVDAIDDELGTSTWRSAGDVPDSFGMARLRETRQRLRSLRSGVLGATAQLNIGLIGDSFTHDNGRYALKVARALWAKYHADDPNELYGPIGVGWISFKGAGSGSFPNGTIFWNNFVTGSGSWTSANGTGGGPDSGSETSSTAGDHLQFASTLDYARGLQYRLFAEGGSGVIRYRWTASGDWTEIDLSALAAGVQIITLTGAPETGTGIFRVEVVSGSCTLYGMDQRAAATAGVIVHKLGGTGTSMNQWANLNAGRLQASLAGLELNLTCIMHGTNDQPSRTKAQFKADALTLIDRVRTARPTTDVLLIAPPENQRANSLPMSEYAAALYEIARDDRDVAFLNLQNSFGVAPADYAAGSARPWWNVDNIHPDNATGGHAISDAILTIMGEASA